jgi:oligopeptide transport system ATP-binding protein
MPDRPVILSVQGIGKDFRVRSAAGKRQRFTAVADVSFELRAGGSVAIVGESGSGKTTCARLVMGIEAPSSGTIDLHLDGPAARGRGRRLQRARHVQMVFQDPYSSLDPRQTVGDAVAECVGLHFDLTRDELEERVRVLLSAVGLELSGGERQRVAIAKALAAEPKVLVLDEAVAALDVSIQAQILNLLAEIRATRGIALLFISHDLTVVEQVCDEVIVMRRGSIVERGPVSHVLRDPQHAYTRRLVDSVPRQGWTPRRHVIAASRADDARE